MHGRGCQTRHTVSCTDDVTILPIIPSENLLDPPLAHSPAPASSGGRTRRTGLLTVMERPPGIKKNIKYRYLKLAALIQKVHEEFFRFKIKHDAWFFFYK